MKTALPRLIAIILLAVAGHASAADVGRVLLAAGDTVAVRDKQVIKLVFGSAVQDKDLLRTGPASNLQVRFIDESILSMRESSEIRIDEFRFAGKEDGTERAFFSLLKGGLRKVTGLIGRTNHKNYQMGSIVATIGIRGTDYATTLCQNDCFKPDGTRDRNGQYARTIGASFGTNKLDFSTQIDQQIVGISQNVFAADRTSRIEFLLEAPGFLNVPVKGKSAKPAAGTGTEEAAAGGAQEDPRGTTPAAPPVVLPRILAGESSTTGGAPDPVTAVTTGAAAAPSAPVNPPNGFVVAYPLPPTAPLGDVVFDDEAPGTYNNLNHLIAYGTLGTFPAGSLNGGSITDTGSLTLSNGQVITWGRWTGNTRITLDDGSTFTGAPVLFGTATGVTHGSVIGSLGGMATYTYAGGPRPVDAGGNVGNITSNTATINFTAQTAFLSLGINFPSIIVASGVNTGPASFSVSGTGFGTNQQFVGDLSGLLSGTCTGSGCFLPGFASGFFDVGLTGPNGFDFAVFAGVITETQAGDVAFLNGYLASSFTSGPPPANLAGQIAWADPTFAPGSTFSVSNFSSTFDASNNLTSFTNPFPCSTGTCTLSGTVGTGSIVEMGSTTLVDGSTMNWGRWNGGQITDRISGTVTTYTPPTGVPFVLGSANTVLPTSGSFTYNFAGGPNPVNTSGTVGTFTGGAFMVNFGATQSISVTSPLTLAVGGVNYSLNTCTSGCSLPGPALIHNMGFSASCTGACTSVTSATGTGIFVGPQAGGFAAAGNISAMNSTTPVPTVTYAGAFKR